MRKAICTAMLALATLSAGQTVNSARMSSGVNPQTGSPAYLFTGFDAARLTTFSNAAAMAANLPSGATTGFTAGTVISAQNQGPGQLTITCVGCTITQPTGSIASTLVMTSGTSVDLYSMGLNYVAVMAGGGALNCGTTASPGVLFWNGTACLEDPNATWDGNGNLSGVSATFSGGVSGSTVSTVGPGGILDLQLQTPPTSVPATHAYVFANSLTGLLDCLKNGLVECFNGLQIIASGTAAMSTSPVSSGGCNITTVSAPGVTTSSRVFANTAVDSTGVSGYGPSTSGGLWIPSGWATTNNVNFKVCNDTANPITGGALSLTWVAF